eukprot:CAMPEP_0177654132 /NCGR_PEP_ID=MMETSP0447-20121125/14140_1 /TAXON_ID=0 /ORGANISM="Stygamoeba regulata, Strain BSH-02190019" /LENGTH=92 /DNA_ID=CAMNT_0019157703 /DNA_START=51 /DNA_END=329 /DNA_ORIENTATION=+
MSTPSDIRSQFEQKSTAGGARDKAAVFESKAGGGAKGKAAMFEQKANDLKPKPVKKTWGRSGNSGGHGGEGRFKSKLDLGAPPEKKSFADLP